MKVLVAFTSQNMNYCDLQSTRSSGNSFQGNVYLKTRDINPQVVFEISTFEIIATSPRGQ